MTEEMIHDGVLEGVAVMWFDNKQRTGVVSQRRATVTTQTTVCHTCRDLIL